MGELKCQKNVEIICEKEVEDIAYMTSFLIHNGWKRTYLKLDSPESKFNLFDCDYVWFKDGIIRMAYYIGPNGWESKEIETKYFTLKEAFNHQCCLDDGTKK